MSSTSTLTRTCRNCRHFRNHASFIEAAMPGLASMSSGYGSVRAEDGICLTHGRYIAADASCPEFSESAESGILPAAACGGNPSLSAADRQQTCSYFSSLIAAPARSLLSDCTEHAGASSMTDLPHELNGLEPPSAANWLAAFGALAALIAIGVLPHVWG